MNWAFVISSGEAEVQWNAFRFANLVLNQMDEVFLFLNGPAVAFKENDSDRFPLKELAKTFALSEGKLVA